MARKFERKKLDKNEYKDTERKAGMVRKAAYVMCTGAAVGLGIAAKEIGPVAVNIVKRLPPAALTAAKAIFKI